MRSIILPIPFFSICLVFVLPFFIKHSHQIAMMGKPCSRPRFDTLLHQPKILYSKFGLPWLRTSSQESVVKDEKSPQHTLCTRPLQKSPERPLFNLS